MFEKRFLNPFLHILSGAARASVRQSVFCLSRLEGRCKRQNHRKDQDYGKDDDQNLNGPVRGWLVFFWFYLIFIFRFIVFHL